jgi:hypothetical protein
MIFWDEIFCVGIIIKFWYCVSLLKYRPVGPGDVFSSPEGAVSSQREGNNHAFK